MFANASIAHA